MKGFWTATFSTRLGTGYGVAYFTDNEVFGGDSAFTYIGTYELSGTQVQAKLRITPYNNSMTSVFGGNQAFDLTISGALQGDTVVGRGAASHFPNVGFQVALKRIK
jgi:hypothetical protein